MPASSLLKTSGPGGRGHRGKAHAALALGTLAALGVAAGTAHAQGAGTTDTTSANGQLPTVTVTGTAEDTTPRLKRRIDAGALGSRTQYETPFSTTALTAEDLRSQQVNKLGDLFSADASVTDNSSAYGAWASYLSVRGLPLDWQNSFRIDGNPYIAYVTVLPVEHFEQVELFKGATGFMNGFGSPGGLLNYQSKRPTDEPLRSVTLGYNDQQLWREHLDLGGRFGDNGRVGYRLNVAHESGDTFNDGSLRRNSVSLAVDARLADALTWDAQVLWQERNIDGQEPTIYTGVMAGGLPAPVRNDNNGLVHDGAFANNRFSYAATGLSYSLSPDWTARVSYAHSATRTHRNESVLNLLDTAGNYADYFSDYAESYRFDHAQALLQGRVSTGGLQHQLVLGASWQAQANRYSVNGAYDLAGSGSLYAPNTNSYFSPGGLQTYKAAEISQRALFASDTLKVSDQWSLLAGLRFTSYEQNGFDTAGATTAHYQKDVLTPTAAVMYSFTPQAMAYASYVESLEQGSTVGTTYANRGALLDPLKSKQYEIGLKAQNSGWSATAALFRIERGAEYANASNELVQDGRSLYQGLELAANARVVRGLDLGASLMLLDAKYDEGSAFEGERVAGSARTTGTLKLSYQLPALPGLKLHASAKYSGETGLRPANDVKVGGYTLFNLGATYDTRLAGYETSWRVSLNNVANKRYWMFQYADYVKAGDPRMLSASATLKF